VWRDRKEMESGTIGERKERRNVGKTKNYETARRGRKRSRIELSKYCKLISVFYILSLTIIIANAL
jgi:hypothetical protein